MAAPPQMAPKQYRSHKQMLALKGHIKLIENYFIDIIMIYSNLFLAYFPYF